MRDLRAGAVSPHGPEIQEISEASISNPVSEHWSPSERKAARVVYDRALEKAREEVLDFHRNKAIAELDDLWEYEREIREWRKELDYIFQYRYSFLDLCFAISLRRGWLQQDDLSGLNEERIARLNQIARIGDD